eukprot:1703228-Rhodomonas_salina.1
MALPVSQPARSYPASIPSEPSALLTRRLLGSDAEASAHEFLATYFEDPASGPIARYLPMRVLSGSRY